VLDSVYLSPPVVLTRLHLRLHPLCSVFYLHTTRGSVYPSKFPYTASTRKLPVEVHRPL